MMFYQEKKENEHKATKLQDFVALY